MGRRTVYGNDWSSNGWPMVDEGSCTWVDVPGCDVRLQIQNGQPLQILRAFAADFNAYVEPLRDADSACWTEGNSVGDSNHLSGTAMDLNWDSHPFQVADAGFSQAKIRKVRELLDFYEGLMFWGNDWVSPKDAMHFQLSSLANGGDVDTYNNPAVGDFIGRKIRSDGFSTFRRGPLSDTDPPHAKDAPATPTPPADDGDEADSPTMVLYDAVPVIDEDRAAQLVDRVMEGLALARCTNPEAVAMYLAQVGHESGGFVYTEEIAKNGRYAPYIGRTWIQITWESNYAGFGKWAYEHGWVDGPDFFVNNPQALADDRWAALGPAWYITVARPQLVGMFAAGDVRGATYVINGGYNGLDDRQARYDQAIALGDRLLLLIGGAAPAPPTQGDESMANVPQDQWDRVYRELTQRHPSRSAVREPGEGLVDTWAGMDLNVDGNVDLLATFLRAWLGYPPAIERLKRVAASAEAGRSPDDALLATAILASLDKPAPDILPPGQQPAPVVRTTTLPAFELRGASDQAASTTGQVIGAAFDALHALLGEAEKLTESDKVTYHALINALNTKIGVTTK